MKRLRYWLITKLAGKDAIILNADIDANKIVAHGDHIYLGSGTYSECTFDTLAESCFVQGT